LIAVDPLEAGRHRFRALNAAEPAHHRGRIGDSDELRLVGVAPGAQLQTLGLGSDLNH
jgi:hypothetical protein